MLLKINYKFLLAGWFVVATPIITYKMYVIHSNNKIIFANYNGYMSPRIISNHSEYIQFESFDNDSKVVDNFKHNIWDVAIVSNSTLESLIHDGAVKSIDWSKLNLSTTSNAKISTATDAKDLYSSETQKILDKNNQYLTYGVPYFLSYFSFFYRGKKIDALEKNSSWEDIIKTISSEPRFKSVNNRPSIAMIDDARTIYSMSRLLNSSTNDINQGDVALTDVKNMYKKWSTLGFNKSVLGNVFFGSETMSLINMLSANEILGAFFYNGDAFYSLQGGEKKNDIAEDTFHTINPKSFIYILDFLVISKNIKPEKEQKLYQFINKTFFEGINDTTLPEGMFKKKDDNYIYGPAQNFDYVFYVPTLQKMIDCLKSNNNIFAEDNDKYKGLKKKMLLLEDNASNIPIMYEGHLNQTKTTNLNLAYEDWKSRY